LDEEYGIASMVANIGEAAAKSEVNVFKWAVWNEYFHQNIGLRKYSKASQRMDT
jgi:hypothetical protein